MISVNKKSTGMYSKFGIFKRDNFAKLFNADKVLKKIPTGIAVTEAYIGDVRKMIQNVYAFAADGVNIGNTIKAKIVRTPNRGPLGFGAVEPCITLRNTARTGIETTAAYYYRTTCEIGSNPGQGLKKKSNGSNTRVRRPIMRDSLRDYQSTEIQKELRINTGFNQKRFTVPSGDTVFNCEDFTKIFDASAAEKQIRINEKGITKVYGALHWTSQQYKFINLNDHYSTSILIRVVRFKNDGDDIKSLVRDITSNQLHSPEKTQDKIPLELQITDPFANASPISGKIKYEFLTHMEASIEGCEEFRRRIEILETYKRVLTPGSKWDFKLLQKFKHGIRINECFNNVKCNRSESIPGAFIIIEMIGDRRGMIENVKTGGYIPGYSPAEIMFNFETKIKYISADVTDETLIDKGIIFTQKRGEDEFEEDEMLEHFHENRDQRMNVNFENIDNKNYRMVKNNVGVDTELPLWGLLQKLDYSKLSADRWEVY